MDPSRRVCIGYERPGSPAGVAVAGLSCSFQGVTTDEIVEAILELELCFFSLAMIAVAGPKLDSRRLYMAELMFDWIRSRSGVHQSDEDAQPNTEHSHPRSPEIVG